MSPAAGPFLVEGGSAADYALRRIRGHSGTLRSLVDISRRWGHPLPADRLFEPELDGVGTTSTGSSLT